MAAVGKQSDRDIQLPHSRLQGGVGRGCVSADLQEGLERNEELKITGIITKHFFTSVKPETQKMAKTTRFSQKVKPMRVYFMSTECLLIVY